MSMAGAQEKVAPREGLEAKFLVGRALIPASCCELMVQLETWVSHDAMKLVTAFTNMSLKSV